MPGGEALIQDAYTRMALVYQERVVPRFRPVAARTVALAALKPGERVLDVGCGTGLATTLAAEAVGPPGSVLGVDYSEGQLGVAEGQRLMRGLMHVRFEVRDATKLGLPGQFDAALSNLGIPPAYEACFAGMRQALRPGGRLSVTEWGPGDHEPFASFRAALAPLQDPGHAELDEVRRVAAQRRARFQELGKPEVFAAALRAAGFEDVEVRVEAHEVAFAGWRDALDFATSWGWAEQEVRALDGEDRAALHAALRAKWGERGFTAAWRMAHATAVAR